MQNITTTLDLKNAIQLLKVEQEIKRHLLKEQFYITYNSFTPANLIKSALNEISSSSNLINNILGTVVGLTSGYLSRKIVVGASDNLLRKLIGAILQYAITKIIAKQIFIKTQNDNS